VQHKYEASVGKAAHVFGLVSFMLLLACVAAFLWFADGMQQAQQLVSVAALMAMLWATGAVLQGRLHAWLGAAVSAASLATAAACFAHLVVAPEVQQQWLWVHRLFKPLGVGFALIYIAFNAYFIRANRQKDLKKPLLLMALACSVMGDAWLMFPGFFIQGLASFLMAHLCYIALFKRDAPWFPNKAALLLCLAYGVAMYVYLLPHLSAGLQLPVAVYILFIALMGAQAIGRAQLHKTQASRWVAVGAVLFMVSDSLLAINKFVSPITLSSLWILGTYFSAQLLMARNAIQLKPD
jgi:alkylglycerol monooxygenase